MKKSMKYILVLAILGLALSGCKQNKPNIYGIGNPVNNEKEYIDLLSITQKNSINIDTKEYFPKKNNVYYILDVNLMNNYIGNDALNLNDATFRVGVLDDDTYTLSKNISLELSPLSENDWITFSSPERKNIKLVFEGPIIPDNATYLDIDIDSAYPFLIDVNEIKIK